MTTATALNAADLWRSHPRESGAIALLALVGAAAIAGTWGSNSLTGGDRPNVVAPPPPPTMDYRPVAPDEAVKINSAIPIAAPAGSAKPFLGASASAVAQSRALDCLTSAIYYEAGQESTDGQRAVAQVVLNRVRHPAFPSSVCGVVYQGSTRQTGCQFTFTCDGSMTRAPMADAWNRARKVAAAALGGSVYSNVGTATHYHAYYVVPYWASSLAKTAVVGAHLFYRWSGGWGQPAAFAQAYSGRESDPKALRIAALAVPHVAPTIVSPVVTMVAGNAVKVEPGGKRVRVLFTPQARAAVEKVVHKPYVETVAASDNLRWAMGDGAPASSEQALGTKPPAKAPTADVSTKAN